MNTLLDLNGEFSLDIDFTKTITEAIADGNYDWKDEHVTAKNFTHSLEVARGKAKLFHFDYDIVSEDAIYKMGKAGYRPATLRELLVLGYSFPELQRQFPIVAFGSYWRDAFHELYATCLSVNGDKRTLALAGFADSRHSSNCRFLAIRLSAR